MGDRAIVRFPDPHLGGGVEVYLHHDANNVPQWLKDAAPRMRKGDASYAAARFIGYCHEQILGGLSLGVMPIGTCNDGLIYTVDALTGKVKGNVGRGFTIKLGEF